MMKMKNWIALTGMTLALGFAAITVDAQGGGGGGFGPGGGGGGFGPGGGGGGGYGPGGGGGGGGRRGFNIDPAQIRQQVMDALRQEFEVTDDQEWSIIGGQIGKVYDAATAGGGVTTFNVQKLIQLAFANANGGGGQGGGFGGQGGGGGRGGGGGLAALFGGGTPSAEDDALQHAIDSKASPEQLKAAITKVMDARKAKLAKLQKAQDDLRQLLTVRQEAIACSLGIL